MHVCDACGKSGSSSLEITPVAAEYQTDTFMDICDQCDKEIRKIKNEIFQEHNKLKDVEQKEAIQEWLIQKQSSR